VPAIKKTQLPVVFLALFCFVMVISLISWLNTVFSFVTNFFLWENIVAICWINVNSTASVRLSKGPLLFLFGPWECTSVEGILGPFFCCKRRINLCLWSWQIKPFCHCFKKRCRRRFMSWARFRVRYKKIVLCNVILWNVLSAIF